MNHIYNIIFNHALGLYQVVSEHTRSKSRAQKRLHLLTDALCIARKDNAAFPKIRPLALALLTACLINLSAYGQELPVFDTDVPSEVTTAASDLKAAINAYAKLPTPANKTALDTAQVDFDAAFDAASAAGAISHKEISTATVYDGQNTASKRLEVASDTSGHISVDSGARLSWLNSLNDKTGDAEQKSHGGALFIGTGAVVVLDALTTNPQETYLFDGNKASATSTTSSARAYGGAIYNGGTLVLGNVTFSSNSAVAVATGLYAPYAYGGAIYNSGTMALGNATFTNNSAFAGIRAYGGAIYNDGTLALSNATFTNNSAASSSFSSAYANGGAIYNLGTLTLGSATFTNNSASSSNANGGAIDNRGNLTLGSATFTNNSAFSVSDTAYAKAYGGAINNDGTLTLTDATFSSNSAFSVSDTAYARAYGGAIYNNSGTLTLNNATFTNNSTSASAPSSAINITSASGGAIYNDRSGTLTLGSATFTNNSASSSSAITITSASGGAIYNDGKMVLSNTTFSANSASATGKNAKTYGGAISNSGTMVLNNASFTNNSASSSSSASAYGGAIYNGGTITLNVDAGNISLFTGNITDNIGTIAASSIYMLDNSTLNVDIAKGGLLDMRDPMGGSAGLQAHTKISQQGSGVWKLGGNNLFTSLSVGGTPGKTTFAVDKGTLYLYRAGEEVNGNIHNTAAKVEAGKIQLDGAGSSFTLASGATLAAGGGNAITTAGKITLESGSTLGFDVANATAGTAGANPILTLKADRGITITGMLNIDLLNLNPTNTSYTLVTANDASNIFSGKVSTTPTLRGEVIGGTRAADAQLSIKAETAGNNSLVTLTQGGTPDNAIMDWNKSGGGTWNITEHNWKQLDGTAFTQFLQGDIVNLKGGADSNITINAGGVSAAAIYLSGGKNYAFSGGGLTTDKTASTLNGKEAASGKLVLGRASKADGSIDKNQTFTGTLDLTKLGTNNFAEGIDIYSGTLKVASAGQIGTSLNKLHFLSKADSSNIGTLQISGNVVLEGAGGNTQRLEIKNSNSANITVNDGASLTWQNSHSNKTGVPNIGGALYINTGAVVNLSAQTTDPKEIAYLFVGNSASSSSFYPALGGAIYNNGTLTLGSAAFTNNSTSTTAADAYGGAIFNGQYGTMVLGNASFTGNSASATGVNAKALGGAIFNNGTIALNVDAGNTSLFTGNITNNNGTVAASSINMWNDSTLSINIAQGGLLDMRDPMGGEATGKKHIQISQQGAGTWKLGGDNVFGSSTSGLDTGKTTFAVNEGTLYLYRADEVANGNSTDPSAMVEAGKIQLDGVDSKFTLGSTTTSATLIASGGNAITTGGTIVLNTGMGSHNTTLSFGLTGATAEAAPTSNNAILNLNAAGGITITGTNLFNIDLLNLNSTAGDYTLVYANGGNDLFNNKVNATPTLRGEVIDNTRANGWLSIKTGTNAANNSWVTLTQDKKLANALMNWNTSNGTWNITEHNWQRIDAGTAFTQFLHGDIVNFDGSVTGGNITINAGGVSAAAIYLSGDKNYTFSGGNLTTDSTTSTLKDKTAASGKLVLGAVANANGTIIDFTQTPFTGTLDLTGIGANNFAQGIDIYGGTLKVESVNQLGTSLNQLSFLSGKSASNIGTLQISGNIVLEGANGDTQRLEIAPDTSANITVDDGDASLSWQNSHNIKTNHANEGGALYINRGAVVVLSALTANTDKRAFLFSGNSASSTSSYASGGAIDNYGTLALNNVSFSNNSASSSSAAYGGAIFNNSSGTLMLSNAAFTGNSTSSTSSSSSSFATAYGGAIYNNGTLTLNNATFAGNSASATGTNATADGGAIYNDGGTLTLNVGADYTSLFTGNITDNNGTIAASSIDMWNDSTLSINIAQDGLLDMRDPMNGDADWSNSINISQQGAGVWKLGGENIFTSSDIGKTTFAVNEGTLYLYRAGEVENANSYDTKAIVGAGKIQLDGVNSKFTLGGTNADTTLVASGGNAIATAGIIELNTDNNTTLSFGLTGAQAEDVPTSNNAILNLNAAKGLSITGGGLLNIDLQNTASTNGQYTLLVNGSTVGDDFSAANVNSDLTLRGQSVVSNSRLDNLGLEINDKSLVLSQNHVNALATWTNAASDGVWDIISTNWHLTDESGAALIDTQYISGDAIAFSDTGNNQTITVHSGGVTPAGMVVNSSHDYTFAGGEIILSPTSTLGTALATGYLEKQGAGTLTFNNQVTGDGHIYGGTMIIGDSAHNNARFSGNVDIYSGATLGGHGQIAGMVTAQSGATIAPGNSIGTLSVGAIIFQSGSTYQFEGNPDGSGDKIIASNLLGAGTARIDSGVNLSILAGAGTWNAATTYSILEADNGVQGQFDHIQTNLSFLTPSLDYRDPNKVGLTLSRNDERFSNAGITYNQRNTGFGIESLNVGHPVYNQIVSMNNEQAQTAFDNLSGEIHASIKSAALNNSRYTRNAINQHLTLNAGEAPEAERNLWVNTWYHDGHLKGEGNAQKLDNKGFGIMMGVDALSYGATTLGVALGYEQAELKLGGSQSSSADMDSLHLMAYGRTKAGPIDIRGAIGYSLLDIESKRNIGVGSLIGTNKADYDGSLIQAYIEGSHTFKAAKNIDITPYINLAYQRVKTDSFTESAGLYSLGSQLKHKGRSDSQTSTTLGVRGLWRINNISDLYADIGWQHTFGRQTPESTFNFIGGQPYRIKGVKTNRNAAVLGIGANFQLTPNMQLSFGYEGHLGNQSRDHSAKLQWKLSF